MVGWSMSAAMTAQLVTDALVMAIWRRGKPDALLHPLHGSVVPHVAGSAHRADDAVVGHQPLELLRPGDRKAARPERSDCRFHLFIAALSRRCDDHLNSLWLPRSLWCTSPPR